MNALVITYSSENYGAFLQAFAMHEFLKTLGVAPKTWHGESCFWHAVGTISRRLRKGKRSAAAKEYKSGIARKIAKARRLLDLDGGRGTFDFAILGSDEIWNVRNLEAPHGPLMFRKFGRARKTIAYAACSGNAKSGNFRFFPYAKRGVLGLDAVSVRDDNTEALLRAWGRKDVRRVLDPTFLHDFSASLPEVRHPNPYLLVYSYGLRSDQIQCIQEVCRKRKWDLVVTGSYSDWADANPVLDPFEWISYVKHAEFVVSTTFHGTAFAIHCRKPFAVFGSKSSKLHGLLAELGLSGRTVAEDRPLEALVASPLDYGMFSDGLERKIRDSKDFVRDSLISRESGMP